MSQQPTVKTAAQKHAKQLDDNKLLQQKQLAEEKFETVKASNKKDEILKHESHLMHVEVMQKTHDKVKKDYITHKNVVKISAKQFNQMELDNAFGVYDGVEIIHDCRTEAEKVAQAKALEAIKKKRSGN